MASVHASWPARAPTPLESLLFLGLMTGPPKFRYRDVTASLTGAVDSVVLLQIVVWTCGGLWVFARLYPTIVKSRLAPVASGVQVLGALFIVAMSLSIWRSPGVMLTGFMLGQFVVMLLFAWVFAARFGPSIYLRHLFAGVVVLALLMAVAVFLAPELVIVGGSQRFRGDRIAPAGPVAAMALVFCLSNAPPLRSALFWPAMAFFGAMLAASRTRTAYIAFVAYLVVGFIRGKGLRVRRLVPLLVGLALSLFLLDAVTQPAEYLIREEGSVQTMSGRLPLWGYLFATVMRDEPLIGLGYYAASRIVAPQYNPGLGNAHSAFFEVLVGGGLVGLAAYLVLCASLLWYAGRLLGTAGGQPNAVAAVGLLCIALIQGITGSEALNAGPIGFTFWSMTALLPAMCREAASRTVINPQRVRLGRRASSVQPAAVGRTFL
jgi:O-antigen ligase